jgi:hypothetical protein
MNPLVNLPNIVVDDLGLITMELGVGPCMITNTSAPQVANPSPSSPKVARLEKSTKCDSNFDHAPINQYLQCPRSPIPGIDVGSRLVIMVTPMDHLQPPIENLFTCQITQGKKPTI